MAMPTLGKFGARPSAKILFLLGLICLNEQKESDRVFLFIKPRLEACLYSPDEYVAIRTAELLASRRLELGDSLSKKIGDQAFVALALGLLEECLEFDLSENLHSSLSELPSRPAFVQERVLKGLFLYHKKSLIVDRKPFAPGFLNELYSELLRSANEDVHGYCYWGLSFLNIAFQQEAWQFLEGTILRRSSSGNQIRRGRTADDFETYCHCLALRCFDFHELQVKKKSSKFKIKKGGS